MSCYDFRDIEDIVEFEIAADYYALTISFPHIGETTKERLEFYDSIRCRDYYNCRRCGKTQEEELAKLNRRLSVHHIDGNHNNDILENCITYCHSCHQVVEGQILNKKKDQEWLDAACEVGAIT